jgi:hypothetical protein
LTDRSSAPAPLAGHGALRVAAASVLALLVLAGLVLPVARTATAASALGHGTPAQVTTGLVLFKVALCALGAAGLLALRSRPTAGAPTVHAWSDAEVERGWVIALVAALVALGVALRIPHLGDGLWFDEIQTLIDYVRLPIGGIVTTFDDQNQHLLYSVAARGAVSLFGESAWALRLPAVVFGAASLAATYWFGRGVIGRAEALLATALLAVSFHHIWFSQDARGYSALLLWTLVSTGCFLRLVSLPAGAPLLPAVTAYAVAMALALYTHATAGVLPLSHAIIALVLVARARGRDGSWRAPLLALVAAGLVTLVLYAPVLPQMKATLAKPTMEGIAVEWKRPGWMVAETVRGLVAGVPGGIVALGLAAVCGVAGAASLARRNPAALAAMVLPGALTAATILALRHNLWPRFFFFSASFAVLVLLHGGIVVATRILGERGRRRAIAGGAAAVLGALALAPRAWGPKQDYVGARQFVERERGTADAVRTIDMTAFPMRAYLGAAWDSVATIDDLRAAEAGHARTFVIYTFPTRLEAIKPDVWERLRTHYRTAAVFQGSVGGGEIVVAVGPSTTTSAAGAQR